MDNLLRLLILNIIFYAKIQFKCVTEVLKTVVITEVEKAQHMFLRTLFTKASSSQIWIVVKFNVIIKFAQNTICIYVINYY